MTAKKEPRVIYSPQVERQIAADPELARAMREVASRMRNALQAVEDGRYATFDEAIAAQGLKSKPLDDEEAILTQEAAEAMEEAIRGPERKN